MPNGRGQESPSSVLAAIASVTRFLPSSGPGIAVSEVAHLMAIALSPSNTRGSAPLANLTAVPAAPLWLPVFNLDCLALLAFLAMVSPFSLAAFAVSPIADHAPNLATSAPALYL